MLDSSQGGQSVDFIVLYGHVYQMIYHIMHAIVFDNKFTQKL